METIKITEEEAILQYQESSTHLFIASIIHMQQCENHLEGLDFYRPDEIVSEVANYIYENKKEEFLSNIQKENIKMILNGVKNNQTENQINKLLPMLELVSDKNHVKYYNKEVNKFGLDGTHDSAPEIVSELYLLSYSLFQVASLSESDLEPNEIMAFIATPYLAFSLKYLLDEHDFIFSDPAIYHNIMIILNYQMSMIANKMTSFHMMIANQMILVTVEKTMLLIFEKLDVLDLLDKDGNRMDQIIERYELIPTPHKKQKTMYS